MFGVFDFPVDALAYLRAAGFQPYADLDPELHAQLGDGVRIVALGQGERLTVLGGTQISVVSGRARLSSTGRTLSDRLTRGKPFIALARGDILQALENTVLAVAEKDFFDTIQSWHALRRHTRESGTLVAERFSRLPRAAPFRRFPLECAEAAFARMQVRAVAAGTEIIRQGAPAATFYTLWSGSAEACQQGFGESEPRVTRVLRSGDTFGEEALATGGPSAASVRMASDGELLELPRAVLLELLAEPLVPEVTPLAAGRLLDAGWSALDVRARVDYIEGHLAGAVSVPLSALRERADRELPRASPYVVTCDSGKCSVVAALFLAQRGFQVVTLKNGLREAGMTLVPGEFPEQGVAVA